MDVGHTLVHQRDLGCALTNLDLDIGHPLTRKPKGPPPPEAPFTNMAQAMASNRCCFSTTTIRPARATARTTTTVAPAARTRRRCCTTMAFLGVKSTDQIQQSPQVKVGDSIPLDHEFLILDVGTESPRSVVLGDLIKGKTAVLFGLPGAFTTLCSSKHVPDYNKRFDDLKAKGVDFIGCTSVNDPWVMREWSIKLGNDLHKVAMLADGEATWHQQLGLLQHIPGLGVRALRYSLLVKDGRVVKVNVEQSGASSYKISGPQTILDELMELEGNEKGAEI